MFIHSASEISQATASLPGVEIKLLVSHPDERGFFREIIRRTDSFFGDGFAQWSHSRMATNTVKAWHFHHRQTDWWYVGLGVLHVALVDNRPESPGYRQKLEFFLGDSRQCSDALEAVVKIPPGVLHGCKVVGDSADLFYITSQTYDPEDEGRIPFDSSAVDHFWGKPEELVVSARDRKAHTPSYTRKPA